MRNIQCSKVNETFRDWKELLTVFERLHLGPLLFIIHLKDLIYIVDKADIFVDDTTSHFSGCNLKEVITIVEHDRTILVGWFRDNNLTLNSEICHSIVSAYKLEIVYASVGDVPL